VRIVLAQAVQIDGGVDALPAAPQRRDRPALERADRREDRRDGGSRRGSEGGA
jgi:hypothetical protein